MTKTVPKQHQSEPRSVWSVVMVITSAIAIAIAPRPKSRENGWELNWPLVVYPDGENPPGLDRSVASDAESVEPSTFFLFQMLEV